MVIDSSALIALLQNEPEAKNFRTRMAADEVRLVSAITLVETSMVALGKKGDGGLDDLADLLARTKIQSVALEASHVPDVVDAFRRFGKGRHPASLNFGDCFSYALARSTGEPLLFKGDDFARTDIKRAS